MSLVNRLLGANPSIQVSTLLSGSLSTPSAKRAFNAGAFESIASYSLTDRTTDVYFLNIPQTYRHLEIRISGRSTGTYEYSSIYITPNSETNAYFSFQGMYGDGSSLQVGSRGIGSDYSFLSQNIAGNASKPFVWGGVITSIIDYTNTTTLQSVRNYGGFDNDGVGAVTGLYGTVNTNQSQYTQSGAITSLRVATDGDLHAGTKIALYGIKG